MITFDSTGSVGPVDNPGRDLLRDWILNKGDDDWMVGSGAVGIQSRTGGLILMKREGVGMAVQLGDTTHGTWSLVAKRPPANHGTFYPGGQAMRVHSRYLVTPDEAWTAVEYYCFAKPEGEMTPQLEWENTFFGDEEFDLSGDDE